MATGVAAAYSFASLGSELAGVSRATGMTVEALSELRTAVDLEDLSTGWRHFRRAVFEAGEGSDEAAEALARFGVTAEQLRAMTPEMQLAAIADGFRGLPNDIDKTALAVKLFGRNGTTLIGLLSRGSAGIAEFRSRMRELGLTVSGEDAEAARDFTREMKILKAQLQMISVQIGAAVLPILRDVVGVIQEVVAPVVRWLRENRELTRTIFLVAAGLVGLGAVIGVVAASVTWCSFAITMLSSAIGLLYAAMGLLLSPVAILVVGITAAAAAAIYFSGAWDAFLDGLQAALGDLSTFLRVWDGLVAAVKAGELELAFQIAWATIRLIWEQGKNWGLMYLLNLWHGAMQIWDNLKLGLISTGIELWRTLREQVIMFSLGVSLLWNRLCTTLRVAWFRTVGDVVGAAAYMAARVAGGSHAVASAAQAIAARPWLNQAEAEQEAGNQQNIGLVAGAQAQLNANNAQANNAQQAAQQAAVAAQAQRVAERLAMAQILGENVAEIQTELNKLLRRSAQLGGRAPKPPLETAGEGMTQAVGSSAAVTFSAAQAAAWAGGTTPMTRLLTAAEQSARDLSDLMEFARSGRLFMRFRP